MIEKFKKISYIFFTVLGSIMVVGGLVLFVFIENPVRYFLYAVVISTVINFKSFRQIRFIFKKVIQRFFVTIGLIYLSLITVLSVSPFLEIQEFKVSHLRWKQVSAKMVTSSSFWDSGYRRKGNTYAYVFYQYQFYGKLYENSEHDALKKYYPFWNRKKTDDLVVEFSKEVSERIDNQDYIIFVNPDKPEKSKLFLSTGLLNIQGSLFYDAVTSVVVMILAFCGIIAMVLLSLPIKKQQIKKNKNK